MRVTALVTLCLAYALANPYFDADPAKTGVGALELWPTARSTALAGAMTGLADEADATYFNPAGLAFQTTAKANVDYGNLLPEFVPGMHYVAASGGVPIDALPLHNRNVYISGSVVYFTVGERVIPDRRGHSLGLVNIWRGTAGANASVSLTRTLGAGIGLKAIYTSHYDWSTRWGEAATVALDMALLYRPAPRVSLGAAVANLGPSTVYRPIGVVAELPRMARVGLRWTPVEHRTVRLRVMPELDKLLSDMFSDTTGKSFGRQLDEEWRDAWKALGIEATAFGLVSLRLGYFEDLTDQRGGVVLEKEGRTYHYGLWDALSRKGLGRLKSIGLCWGIGIGTNTLRFDLSSDAAIYDFPTTNWKFQLTCNDIGGLFRARS
jgi:hypothetical protein